MTNNFVNHRPPDFLGIGTMRSGTTWLYSLLKSHPEVFVPEHVKELHFFDKYYDRGFSWYLSFFPPNNEEGNSYKVVGEVTPEYLYREAVPARVQEDLPHAKFIVLLRNPVDRAYSHYRLAFSRGNTSARSFSQYLQETPEAFGKGLYAAQLNRWLSYFPKERFLILIFEEATRNPATAADSIASFLEIDRQQFDNNRLESQTGAAYLPKYHGMFSLGIKAKRVFRKHKVSYSRFGLFLTTSTRQIFKRLGQSKNDFPSLEGEVRQQYLEKYTPDIEQLEQLLNRELSLWGHHGR